ncbi:MAG: iron uptake protein [Rhodocyclaceae bacterium]
MSSPGTPSPVHIVSRIAAGLLGGYGFVWGFVTLGIALLMTAGMPYDDARTTLYLLAFVVFLCLFCWAFAAASLWRVWAVLSAGAAAMTGAAWLLIPSLI